MGIATAKRMVLAALTAIACAVPQMAAADQVTIRTVGGGMAIKGELIDFNDEFLVVRMSMGEIRIRRELAICDGPGCPEQGAASAGGDSGQVPITASNSIGAKLLPRLLQGFAQQMGGELAIEIDPAAQQLVSRVGSASGSTSEFRLRLNSTERAFGDLLNGQANMIVTSRRVTDAEAQQFIEAGIGDIRDRQREVVIALDGLTFVVAPGNAIPTLSLEQAAEIAAGRITDWSEVGGRPGPINVYLPPDNDDALDVFAREVMRPLRLRPSRDADQSESGEGIAAAVASDARGIGLTTLAQRGDARAVALQQSCGLLVEPDAFSVKAEEYPLARRIYIYTRAPSLPGAAGDFFRFVQSEAGQQSVLDVGFVDQRVLTRTVNDQGLRFVSAIVSDQSAAQLDDLRGMATTVQTADRVSTTLRFNAGSSTLQPKSLADIERLIDLVSQPAHSNKEILLLGFTDSVGRADINQFLSAERAEGVKATILSLAQGRIDPARLNAIGYGPIAPIGCNDQPRGREINRRVEVWLRG